MSAQGFAAVGRSVQRVHVRHFRSNDPAFCKEIDGYASVIPVRPSVAHLEGNMFPSHPVRLEVPHLPMGLSLFPGQVKPSSVNQIINARISS